MGTVRIALANLRYPADAAESVDLAADAIQQAGRAGALVICFPECFVPGYRTASRPRPAADPAFLDPAWSTIADTAAGCGVGVIRGTERPSAEGVLLCALVIGPDGARVGFQDKVQLDPSEEADYVPGQGRGTFRIGPLAFGISICHEGFRYPETVRWAARNGAQVVFHPHFTEAEPDS